MNDNAHIIEFDMFAILGSNAKFTSFGPGASKIRNSGSNYLLSVNAYKAYKRANDISACLRLERRASKSSQYSHERYNCNKYKP